MLRALHVNRGVSRETIDVVQQRLREHIMASVGHYADYFKSADEGQAGMRSSTNALIRRDRRLRDART